MKAGIIALILLLFLTLFSPQILSMEIQFEGQKDFWTDLSLEVIKDLTGEEQYYTNFSYGQSFDLYFSGEDELGFVRGYITDHPQLMEQIYLDMLLGDYTLQWDNYEQAFLVPSWFNLEQKFKGLRFGYLNPTNQVSVIGVKGDKIFREDNIFVTPGAEENGISLFHAPIAPGSIQVWLDNRQLVYGEEYYVTDYERGVIELKVPVEKPGILRIRYLEEGRGYLVFGSRYDHTFSPQLDGGLLMMLAQGDGVNQGLIGSELIYQLQPWWTVEFNAGFILQEQQQPAVEQVGQEVIGSWVDEPQEINGNFLTDPDFNWRMAHQFKLPGLDVSVDYQVIENNLQSLLFGGQEGKRLTIDALYDKDNFLVRHSEIYQWTMDDFPYQRSGELEFVYFSENWIPYFYFSQEEQAGLIAQHGILELGYLSDLQTGPGSMTYQVGVDAKTTPEEDFWQSIEPYLGVRYDKDPESSLGARIYGRKGGQFARLVIDGTWSEGFLNWKGELNLLPDYYRINQNITWNQLPVDIKLDMVNRQYFDKDEDYLNLELNLDWSKLLGEQATLWVSLSQDEGNNNLDKIYKLGFEKYLKHGLTGYGEVGFDDDNSYYSGGIRGLYRSVDYDLNYTWAKTMEPLEGLVLAEVRKNKLAFSLGTMDYWDGYGELEVDNWGRWWTDLGVKYPIMPQLELNIQYSIDKMLDYIHKMTVRTVYYF